MLVEATTIGPYSLEREWAAGLQKGKELKEEHEMRCGKKEEKRNKYQGRMHSMHVTDGRGRKGAKDPEGNRSEMRERRYYEIEMSKRKTNSEKRKVDGKNGEGKCELSRKGREKKKEENKSSKIGDSLVETGRREWTNLWEKDVKLILINGAIKIEN